VQPQYVEGGDYARTYVFKVIEGTEKIGTGLGSSGANSREPARGAAEPRASLTSPLPYRGVADGAAEPGLIHRMIVVPHGSASCSAAERDGAHVLLRLLVVRGRHRPDHRAAQRNVQVRIYRDGTFNECINHKRLMHSDAERRRARLAWLVWRVWLAVDPPSSRHHYPVNQIPKLGVEGSNPFRRSR
jgi:hypothetical protein